MKTKQAIRPDRILLRRTFYGTYKYYSGFSSAQ